MNWQLSPDSRVAGIEEIDGKTVCRLEGSHAITMKFSAAVPLQVTSRAKRHQQNIRVGVCPHSESVCGLSARLRQPSSPVLSAQTGPDNHRKRNISDDANQSKSNLGHLDNPIRPGSDFGLSGESIICFAGEDWWYHHPHSKNHILKRLAKQNRVLFVNSITMGLPSVSNPDFFLKIRRKFRSYLRWLRKVPEGLFVLTSDFLTLLRFARFTCPESISFSDPASPGNAPLRHA